MILFSVHIWSSNALLYVAAKQWKLAPPCMYRSGRLLIIIRKCGIPGSDCDRCPPCEDTDGHGCIQFRRIRYCSCRRIWRREWIHLYLIKIEHVDCGRKNSRRRSEGDNLWNDIIDVGTCPGHSPQHNATISTLKQVHETDHNPITGVECIITLITKFYATELCGQTLLIIKHRLK